MTFYIFFIIHISASVILTYFIMRKKLHIEQASAVLLFCLPVFGEMLILMISYRNVAGHTGQKNSSIDRDKNLVIDSSGGFFDTDPRDTSIPLEDALIINSGADRQKILRDAVLAGTNGKSAFLELARKDDNPEIVHFATTAMAYADSQYEKKLTSLENSLKKKPDDLEAMDILISHLWDYLKNPSDDKAIYELRMNRYIEVLNKRVLKHPTPEYMTKLAGAYIEAGDYEKAEKMLNRENLIFPNDPDAWIMFFRLHYVCGDREAMSRMIESYKNSGVMKSSRIDRIIEFWTAG